MAKINKLKRSCDIDRYCNDLANQYLLLVTVFSGIIANEIEDDEELGILASFFVAIGEELALASETRIACKARFKDEGGESGVIEDVFDRGIHRKNRKVVKKYVKKVKRNPYKK